MPPVTLTGVVGFGCGGGIGAHAPDYTDRRQSLSQVDSGSALIGVNARNPVEGMDLSLAKP